MSQANKTLYAMATISNIIEAHPAEVDDVTVKTVFDLAQDIIDNPDHPQELKAGAFALAMSVGMHSIKKDSDLFRAVDLIMSTIK